MKYMTITPHMLEYIDSLEKHGQLQDQLIKAQDQQIKNLEDAREKLLAAYEELLNINEELSDTNRELTEIIREHVDKMKKMGIDDQKTDGDEED